MPTFISLPAENSFYQPRRHLRKQLLDKLKKEHLVTLTSLTSRGKSEEAKAFAYDHLKYFNEYEVVIWINCSNREKSYEEAAQLLSLDLQERTAMRTVFSYLEQISQSKPSDKPSITDAFTFDFGATMISPGAKPSAPTAESVQTLDSSPPANRWLLILDNADETDLKDLPLKRNGDIILTSCNTDLPNLVFVPNLERHESQQLILRTLGEYKTSIERSQCALALADAASDFPGAVTELSKAIKHRGSSLEDETKTYEQQEYLFKPTVSLEQLQAILEDERRFPAEDDPDSLLVLRCLAQLGPFNVPRTLLYHWGDLCDPALSPSAIHNALHDLVCKGYIELCPDRQGTPCFMDAPIINSLRSIFIRDEKSYLAEFKRVIQALVLQLNGSQETKETLPISRINEERDMCIWHAKLIFHRMLNAAGMSNMDTVLIDVAPIVKFIPTEERIIYLHLIKELTRYYRRFDQLHEAIRYSAVGIKFIEQTSTNRQLHLTMERARRLSDNGGYSTLTPSKIELTPIYDFFKQWLVSLNKDSDKFRLLGPILGDLILQIKTAITDPAFVAYLKTKGSIPASFTPELIEHPEMIKAYLEFYILKSLEENTSQPLFWSLIALIPNQIVSTRTLDENDGLVPMEERMKVGASLIKPLDVLLINNQPYLLKWTGSPDHRRPIYPYHQPYFPVFNPLKKSNEGLKTMFTLSDETPKDFLDTYAALLTYHASSLYKQQDEYNSEALSHLQLAFKELNIALIICFNILDQFLGGIKQEDRSPRSEGDPSERAAMQRRILYLKKLMVEITLEEIKLQQKSMQMVEVHLDYSRIREFFEQYPYNQTTNKTIHLSFQLMLNEAIEDRIWWPIHFLHKIKRIKNEFPNLAQKAAYRVNPFVQANANATAFFAVVNRWPHVFSEHFKACDTLGLKIKSKGMNPEVKSSFEKLMGQAERAINEKIHFCQAAIKSQPKPDGKAYASIISLLESHLEKPVEEKESQQIKLWLTLGRLYIKQYKQGIDFNKEEKKECLFLAQHALKSAQKMYYDFEREDHPSWELYDLYYSLIWIIGKKEISTQKIDPRRETKIIQYLLKIRSIASQLYDGSTEKNIRQALKLYNTLLAVPGSIYPKANNLFTIPLTLPLKNAETLLNKLNALIQDQPENISVFLERAEILVNIGAYEQAIIDYKRYLKVYPDSAPSLAGKGYAHYKLGDAANRQMALCDFASARQKMPDNPFIQYQQKLVQKASKKTQMNLQRPVAPSSKFALFIKFLSEHFALKLKVHLDKAKGTDPRDSKAALFGKAVKATSSLLPSTISAFGVSLDVNLKEVVSGLADIAVDAHDKTEQYKNNLLADNISESILKPDGIFSSIAYDIAIIYEDQIGVIARSAIDRFARYIASNMVHYLRSNLVPPYIPLREKLIMGTTYARHRWFEVSLKVDREAAHETLRSMSFFPRIFLTGCHAKSVPFGWGGFGITAKEITTKAGIRTSDGELYGQASATVGLFGYRAGTIEEALEKGFTLISTPYLSATTHETGILARKNMITPPMSVHASLSELQMVLLSVSSKKAAFRDAFDQFLNVNFGLIKEKVAPGPHGGSCQFMAIATQLAKCSPTQLAAVQNLCPLMTPVRSEHIKELAQELRIITSRHLLAHQDDFKPFIGENARKDDMVDEFNQAEDIPAYAASLERGAWGGALSLRALGCVLQHDILILHPDMMIPRATTMENRIFRAGEGSSKPYLPSRDLSNTLVLVYNGSNHYDTIVAHPPSDDTRLADYISAQMVRSSAVLQRTILSRKSSPTLPHRSSGGTTRLPDLFFQLPPKESTPMARVGTPPKSASIRS
ncbi:MAG: hypothetical protein NTW94_02845 [Legionellales bacterium]|nr:hypothetical protein [Legionellales bacterium]